MTSKKDADFVFAPLSTSISSDLASQAFKFARYFLIVLLTEACWSSGLADLNRRQPKAAKFAPKKCRRRGDEAAQLQLPVAR